jgi:hypothetical protein
LTKLGMIVEGVPLRTSSSPPMERKDLRKAWTDSRRILAA